MIDREGLHEFRSIREDRLVQAVEADLDGAGLHPRAIQHVLQAHADPARIAQRTVGPLATGDARLWLEAQLAAVSGKSTIAAAIRYALSRWDGLARFLDDGRVEIDSNVVQR